MLPKLSFRIAVSAVLIAIGLLPLGASVQAEATRLTNPNAVSVEFGGRGMMYSIGYDRVINDDLAAGFALGSVSTEDFGGNATGITAAMLPVYVNYYFTRTQGSIFLTGGATLVINTDDVQGLQSYVGGLTFPGSALLPEFGAGYESRGDSGFLFRLTAYGIVGTKVVPWVGITLGYAF